MVTFHDETLYFRDGFNVARFGFIELLAFLLSLCTDQKVT